MNEVLQEAIAYVNLPFTVLLGLVVLYWLLVALGAVESDLHGGGELDAHADLHVHGDGVELHHDYHGDHHHAVVPHKDAHGDHDGDGWFGSVAQFVNLGEVPMMVVISVISLSLWIGSLAANHYLTGNDPVWALALLVPNLAVAIVVTRYVTLPLRPVFRLLRRDGDETPSFLGKPCRITARAGTSFGQAEIEREGSPLLIHVRTLDGRELTKGETAVVVREDLQNDLFYVAPVPPLDSVTLAAASSSSAQHHSVAPAARN